jgi:Tfp pilus assembly protein PilN
LGNNTGFSPYLAGLGRQSLATLSLNVFSLQKGGRYLELMGVARSADQVPLYVERLRQEPAFHEVSFGVLSVQRAKNSELYDFSLAEQNARDLDERSYKTLVQSVIEKNKLTGGTERE